MGHPALVPVRRSLEDYRSVSERLSALQERTVRDWMRGVDEALKDILRGYEVYEDAKDHDVVSKCVCYRWRHHPDSGAIAELERFLQDHMDHYGTYNLSLQHKMLVLWFNLK